MVFKEEFEYLSFKCCYCGFFNPSLKKRPSGPQLKPTISQPVADTSESSDSDLSSVESDQVFTRTGITEETVDNGNLFGPVPRKSTDGELLDQVEKTASEVQDPGDSPVTLMEENESNTNPFEESKHQLQVRVNPYSDDSEPEISPEAPNFEAQEKED